MPANDLKLYAQWKDIAYTVTYDLNGGDGTIPTEADKVYGEKFSAAQSAGLTAPTGKEFKEWNTSPSGDGTGYAAGGEITMPANDLKLYAQWKDIAYTVTYDLNGGDGTIPTEADKVYGEKFSAAQSAGLTAPTGKEFKEWNTSPSGDGTGYAAGGEITMPANDLKLYAQWKDIAYTVTYDLNGGDGTIPTEADKVYGEKFSAAQSAGLTAPTGKEFKEWNTSPSGDGAGYAAGGEITMPANDLKLYAIWDILRSTDFTVVVSIVGSMGGTASALPEDPVEGDDVVITIIPNKRYTVYSVKDNGTQVGPVDNGDGTWTYVILSIDSDHTIEITFQNMSSSPNLLWLYVAMLVTFISAVSMWYIHRNEV